jgi:hypothetical protein
MLSAFLRAWNAAPRTLRFSCGPGADVGGSIPAPTWAARSGADVARFQLDASAMTHRAVAVVQRLLCYYAGVCCNTVGYPHHLCRMPEACDTRASLMSPCTITSTRNNGILAFDRSGGKNGHLELLDELAVLPADLRRQPAQPTNKQTQHGRN